MPRFAFSTVLFSILCIPLAASADPVRPATVELDGMLTTGTLAGTPLSGLFSYNAGAATGVGTEFLGLLTFDVNLLGVHFTRAGITRPSARAHSRSRPSLRRQNPQAGFCC
jgi:hypothetical protein